MEDQTKRLGSHPATRPAATDRGTGWPFGRWWEGASALTPQAEPGDFIAAFARNPMLTSIDKIWNANPLHKVVPIDWAAIAYALRVVWLRTLVRPDRAIAIAAEFNVNALRSAANAWSDATMRWWGESQDATAAKRDSDGDKRFAAPEWRDNPAFSMLKDLYLLASESLLRIVARDGANDDEEQRINFHLRQFISAMSPSLMLFGNPVALRRAVESGGASLADGLRNLLDDVQAGRLSMVDATAFAPGRNLALTPGKVVHRNRLLELIQYSPATAETHAIPILILPPWINKFYILDMQPKNSMVKHLVDQGFTVFMASWKNPDASMEDIAIEDYMRLGPLEACDVIREITGQAAINVMGYCIAGTLLAMTLAWLAAKQDRRFNAATFIVSLQDFSKVGDTAVFADESAVDLIEQQMLQRGYLDSREMSNMFNLLRPNDLIWSNVVNNYLLGQAPPAFDLLYWNSDGTRMARAAHSWYLRNTYLENNLIQPNKVRLDGETLDLRRIELDVYAVGAEKDHIVPWEGAWRITQLLGGAVRFVLVSSGHIAGIINPPGGKGAYWVNRSATPAGSADQWRDAAVQRKGSWWVDWDGWLAKRSGGRAAPPRMGSATHPALNDAPGSFVLEK
ncbi:alpha/beta hydrolase [Acidisoma sp. L85]|uniref:PHA/PHB synthase family protein n=1 Tax=Acidisoma sp. L85 TaxID=1641850 RepID=UPI00131C3B33|nr:class I poly(R)-hydroxyalkanoic acid synthase [Acidisoma sp. L85]